MGIATAAQGWQDRPSRAAPNKACSAHVDAASILARPRRANEELTFRRYEAKQKDFDMALAEVLAVLPPALQEQAEGYARFVAELSDQLFAERNVSDPTAEQQQTLLTLAVAWKLWRSIDSQYWLLNNSLSLLGNNGVEEIAVGGSTYSWRSATFDTLRTLRAGLLDLFGEAELTELTQFRRLGEVVALSLRLTDEY